MKTIRKKSHEKLDDANLKRVFDLLNGDNPITKKEACGMLNITYNTTRLSSIMADFDDTLKYREKRKAQNRGKKATEQEIKQAVEMFLDEENVSGIAKRLYRSTTFVKNLLDRVGVPEKRPKTEGGSGSKVAFLPDQCVAEKFEPGEKVWAARYDLPARIVKGNFDKRYDCWIYHIYVIELTNFETQYFGFMKEGGFNSHQCAYDLGSLRHLKKYDIDI